jgi:hypothetical protein
MVDLIAAQKKLDTSLADKRLYSLRFHPIVQKRKRSGRLRPDDQLRSLRRRLACHLQIGIENVRGMGGVPLLVLRDVPLNQSGPDRLPLLTDSTVLQSLPTPDDDARHECRRHRQRRQRFGGAGDDALGNRRAHERDDRRQAEHADEARHLGDRKDGRLAVAQEQPRKPAPEICAAKLGSHPHSRCEQNGPAPELRRKPRQAQREQGRKEGEVRNEQGRHHDAHRPAQPAKLSDDRTRPVHGATEVAQPCDQPEQKRPLTAGWRKRPADPGRCRRSGQEQREKQRNERDPGKCRMAVPREAQRQQNAGKDCKNQGGITWLEVR